MNHDALREFLVSHIERDDADHKSLMEGLQAHIAADEPDDGDHAAIVALVEEHVATTEASHARLLRKLDEHIERRTGS
jgi:hypothetical protein